MRPVAALLAGIALILAPVPAFAQDRDADKELEDLIPDSALDNPEQWALENPAVQGADAEAPLVVEEFDPAAPLAELPEFQLAWPDAGELPKIDPLSPDPDIQLAQDQVEGAVEALPGALPGAGGELADAPRIADPAIERIGRQVELAFPNADAAFPERDDFAERFAGLSNLKRLSSDEGENIAQLARRARTDRELLLKMLRVYGYYDAEVYQTLGGLSEDGSGEQSGQADLKKVVVRFDVLPGPQYQLRNITLGDLAGTGADYAGLRKAFALVPGDPVNSDRIVEERIHLDFALGETGYAYVKVGEPDLLIDHDPRIGDLDLPVTTGGKYEFGRVISSLPRFLPSRHLERIARFDKGDLYQRSLQDDLRQAILATGLVSSVTVATRQVETPQPGDPGTVDIAVSMVPAPLRTIAGLAGYSSGEGFRVEASWEHRNLFPPEGALKVRGVLGTREQLVGVTFRRNNFRDRDQVLTLDLYGQTVDRDAYAARTVSLLGTFERQTTLLFQKPWVWSVGLEVLASGEREGSVNGVRGAEKTYFIGAIPLRGEIDRSDSLLDPRRGFRAGLRLSPEVSVQSGMRSTYVKAQADASYYQPVTENVVVAGRVRLGSITGADITRIAPSRRFYAGGGGSVRGYGYQKIGPRDSLGEPTGGKSLSEFSLEARVRTGLVGGAVSFVPFIDAGAVDETSTPRLRDLKIGVGIGLRYDTNFGPIRIDVGTPLNPSPGDSRIGVYVALGQAF